VRRMCGFGILRAMFGTEGTIAIRMQGNAYQALLGVESLVSAGMPASERVGHYLNCELWRLTAVLEDLKSMDPTEELAAFAERFRLSFGKLQHISGTCCQRLGMRVRHAFRRMGGILYCLFRRRGRTWPENARLAVREAERGFRTAVLDRLADSLRGLFAWLRDLCGRAEALDALPVGPVILGMSAAQFVVKADTAEGVLVMRFQDGHQELFNLTPAQWALVMPLLVTRHELGHARLAGRPQSLLTRHDANGDEASGDLKRLKLYIHPVGRGRGGNGLYYLAPHPRRANTVG